MTEEDEVRLEIKHAFKMYLSGFTSPFDLSDDQLDRGAEGLLKVAEIFVGPPDETVVEDIKDEITKVLKEQLPNLSLSAVAYGGIADHIWERLKSLMI